MTRAPTTSLDEIVTSETLSSTAHRTISARPAYFQSKLLSEAISCPLYSSARTCELLNAQCRLSADSAPNLYGSCGLYQLAVSRLLSD